MDQVQATPARGISGSDSALTWDEQAQDALREWVQLQPVLVQISAAKGLRDKAEQLAQRGGADRVSLQQVRQALGQTARAAAVAAPSANKPMGGRATACQEIPA